MRTTTFTYARSLWFVYQNLASDRILLSPSILDSSTSMNDACFSLAEQLVSRVAASLSEDQRAYLIHHVGGSREFGVYEVRREAEDYAVSVVCRDAYHQTASWTPGSRLDELPTYTIWLDTVAQTPSPTPTCQSLRPDP